MVAVTFPVSTAPGRGVGEDMGRLLNCYAEDVSGSRFWRRLPGMLFGVDTGLSKPRGMFNAGSAIYAAFENGVVRIDAGGAVTRIYGALSGDEPVTWARNNASPAPTVLVHSDLGTFDVTTGAIVSFPDGDLPATNSLAMFDGYFVWTTESGQVWASNLNSSEVNALSFLNIQSTPAGMLRGVVSGAVYYAMGRQTITPLQNVGTTPFPLAPAATTIPVGLAARWAVAGMSGEWDHAPIFVASDNTVRVLDGFAARRVSTPPVERMIEAVADKNDLRACVYAFGGNSIWSLSSPTWTLEYNVATGGWHERESYGLGSWRGRFSVNAFGKWHIGDRTSTHLLTVSEPTLDEAGSPLVFGADSAPVKDFPSRAVIASAHLDFTLGGGRVVSSPTTVIDPTALVSWSGDGGARWAAPAVRQIGKAGRYVGPVKVHRLGQATHHGFRLRWRVSAPVEVSFMGATIEGQDTAA